MGLERVYKRRELNYAYLPVLIDPDVYGMTRDALHATLAKFNVISRKYFYPLCSHYSSYSSLPSARPENLPVAERIAQHAPLAVAASKQIVRQTRGLTEEDAWTLQSPHAAKVFTSQDAKEGPRAFAEKRPPHWTGK